MRSWTRPARLQWESRSQTLSEQTNIKYIMSSPWQCARFSTATNPSSSISPEILQLFMYISFENLMHNINNTLHIFSYMVNLIGFYLRALSRCATAGWPPLPFYHPNRARTFGTEHTTQIASGFSFQQNTKFRYQPHAYLFRIIATVHFLPYLFSSG